jgi:hypothetical protein
LGIEPTQAHAKQPEGNMAGGEVVRVTQAELGLQLG